MAANAHHGAARDEARSRGGGSALCSVFPYHSGAQGRATCCSRPWRVSEYQVWRRDSWDGALAARHQLHTCSSCSADGPLSFRRLLKWEVARSHACHIQNRAATVISTGQTGRGDHSTRLGSCRGALFAHYALVSETSHSFRVELHSLSSYSVPGARLTEPTRVHLPWSRSASAGPQRIAPVSLENADDRVVLTRTYRRSQESGSPTGPERGGEASSQAAVRGRHHRAEGAPPLMLCA